MKARISIILVISITFLMGTCFLLDIGYMPDRAEPVESDMTEVSSRAEPVESDMTEVSSDVELEGSICNAEKIVEDTQYYKVVCSDGLFYCYFYDQKHVLSKMEGPLAKQPNVKLVGEKLVRLTVYAGADIGTQWGYYYSAESNEFSEVFHCIYDEHSGKVVYTEQNSIIVRDIFCLESYYKKIDNFKYVFSPAAVPFTKINFAEEGTSLQVTYLSGTDYQEVTEEFVLEN